MGDHGRVSGHRCAGLILTPGAGGRRTQSGLVAIDASVSELGIVVHRVEFPGQAAGKRRPDPPDACIATVRDATSALARELDVGTGRIAIGGRSFGGRMCSLAAAQGLDVAGLVLVSYPLHPPDHPDRLRTSHFPDLHVPCLFVSGRADAYATPDELAAATAAIAGDVTITHVDGDHSLRRTEREAAAAVARWAVTTSSRDTQCGDS
jgi:predicted alpha/beta-hydrolase family hydrolase